MTLYDARGPGKLRLTLRLRLALLAGILLLIGGAFLVLLAWLIVGKAVDSNNPPAGTKLVRADGTGVDASSWQRERARDAKRETLLIGAVALIATTGFGVAGGYVLAGRALRPLHRVTTTARRLSGETLDQRISYTGPEDEVAELADTFDAMLDRIAAAFDTQKRFVANASHELRTPLAVMRTEVEVTLGDPDADVIEFRRMGTVVRDASIRANALVEALLLLARTEAQAGRRLARKLPADLATGAVAALSAGTLANGPPGCCARSAGGAGMV